MASHHAKGTMHHRQGDTPWSRRVACSNGGAATSLNAHLVHRFSPGFCSRSLSHSPSHGPSEQCSFRAQVFAWQSSQQCRRRVPAVLPTSSSLHPASSSWLPGVLVLLGADVEVDVVKVVGGIVVDADGVGVPHVPCGSAGSNFCLNAGVIPRQPMLPSTICRSLYNRPGGSTPPGAMPFLRSLRF